MTRTTVPAGSLLLMPLGISTTSVSRLSVMGWLVTGISITYLDSFSLRFDALCLFGRDRVLLAFERGLQRVPGERGALHAHRKFRDAGENGELAEFGLLARATAHGR